MFRRTREKRIEAYRIDRFEEKDTARVVERPGVMETSAKYVKVWDRSLQYTKKKDRLHKNGPYPARKCKRERLGSTRKDLNDGRDEKGLKKLFRKSVVFPKPRSVNILTLMTENMYQGCM